MTEPPPPRPPPAKLRLPWVVVHIETQEVESGPYSYDDALARANTLNKNRRAGDRFSVRPSRIFPAGNA